MDEEITVRSYGSDFASLDFDFECCDAVSCMLCDESFEVTVDPQPLLQHLLVCHRFTIAEVEQVADLRQYVLYWGKLRGVDIHDYCVVINTNCLPGDRSPTESYYLLCDKLPEDRHLRHTLTKMKLRFIVEQKEKERNDVTFSRPCIYCRRTIGGGVTQVLHHLTNQHSFTIGNPDNIVYGAQLLDLLHDKLTNLVCLCCEKVFRSFKMLRQHMRKHQHRCLNPKNKVYDKFYLRNYLRPGTPWEETKRELERESDTESLGEGDGETEWREDDTPPTTCLFCQYTTLKIPGGLFHHMRLHHNFDFELATNTFTFYQKVKIVNYIRTCIKEKRCPHCCLVFGSPEYLEQHLSQQAGHCNLPNINTPWNLPQFHIPVFENDGLLLHLEDNEMDENDPKTIPSNQPVFAEDIPSHQDSILRDPRIRHLVSQTEDDGREPQYDDREPQYYDRVYKGSAPHHDDRETQHHDRKYKDREPQHNDRKYNDREPQPHDGVYNVKGPQHNNDREAEYYGDLGILECSDGERDDDEQQDGAIMCLFCRYTSHGSLAHGQVCTHMTTQHCFDLTQVFNGLPFYTQVKLVNYIRWKTSKSECYICSRVYEDSAAMEEHRVLANHVTLPHLHLFHEQRWLRPVLESDGLLQRLRETGDSDDEDPTHPDGSRGENVFSEELHIPTTSILRDQTLRQELMYSSDAYVCRNDEDDDDDD
ncbi:hypothetical protein Pmani_008210 [Petrolisthes manimaculis]|nr:hypothetical protein Pmani_008210 [Petrolisthes manimaculis]